MKDPNLTATDLVESDFFGRRFAIRQERQGQMLSLRGRSITSSLLQQELFQKKGVAVPKTLDEMVAPPRSSPTPRTVPSVSSGAACRNAT